MSTDRAILRLGKQDEGRYVSSEEFVEAEFDEPWRYEREDGRLIVMAPVGEGHIDASEPWRDQLVFYKLTYPGIIQKVVNEAWIRVQEGADRIGDLGVYLRPDGPILPIPDRIPDLLFEIVSPDPTSRDRDDVEKRAESHRLGIREYVIVDRFRKSVTVLTLASGEYDERILLITDVYKSPLLPGFSVRLSDVF